MASCFLVAKKYMRQLLFPSQLMNIANVRQGQSVAKVFE